MDRSNIGYEMASIASAPAAVVADGKRLPLGWPGVLVGERGEEVKLKWPESSSGRFAARGGAKSGLGSRLRITVALEFREKKRVEAYLLQSDTVLGYFDLRYAYVYEPFEIALDAAQTEAALREGVGLRSAGGEWQLWIFGELGGDEERKLFAPHLLLMEKEDKRMERFLEQMTSLSSLQPFGWLEGCALDGLNSLRPVLGEERTGRAISAHMQQFFDDEGRLVYEDLHGNPADGKLTTNEATLPIAVIAKMNPNHPVVAQTVQFLQLHSPYSASTTAEGCYTIAYPLAVIATRCGRPELAEEAIRHLLYRRDQLANGRILTPRTRPCGFGGWYRNWARGYAWYMLGITRTWIELSENGYGDLPGMSEIAAEARRIADVALSWRLPEKLWSCYLDEPETGIETSGSSGIAAALALGAKHGLLPREMMADAEDALAALVHHLTPDGILGGVSQHNCGGEELQKGGYRVLSQMGMGLMAQLYAAVRS